MTRRMRISRPGLELIQRFEGFRPKAQRLSDGRFLIGYGHTKSAREGALISEADALLLLREYDLPPVEKAVSEWVLCPLHQNEFDALVSFVHNIGLSAFRGSAVLAHLSSGDKLAAAEAMGAWRKARLDGRLILVDALVRRRAAERALFLAHPSGQPAVTSVLMRPQLDMAAAIMTPREKAVLVETEAGGERAQVRAAPQAADSLAAPGGASARPHAAEIAAREVGERLSRILGEERSAPSAAAPAEGEEPSIEEITRAVSALAEPPLQPKDQGVASAPAASRPADGPRRRVDVDDLEPAEIAMADIRQEFAAQQAERSVQPRQGGVRPARPVTWPWLALAAGGIGMTVWGLLDRFLRLPPELTLTGGDFDPLAPFLILAGAIVFAVGAWQVLRRALGIGR